jgi:hypothetical protein
MRLKFSAVSSCAKLKNVQIFRKHIKRKFSVFPAAIGTNCVYAVVSNKFIS